MPAKICQTWLLKFTEILVNNSDRTKDFYEAALKNLALNFSQNQR
ncbi:hypothetical protein VB002_06440 [Campylobacter concisus]